MIAEITQLDPDRIEEVVDIWHAGWHEAHAFIVPPALAKTRTRSSFLHRLSRQSDAAFIAEADQRVLGFCIVKRDELYQLYVGPAGRGTGTSKALVQEAERRIRSAGFDTGWLACAIGNTRAARFYEKCGWRNAGEADVPLETDNGPYVLNVWRYEKSL